MKRIYQVKCEVAYNKEWIRWEENVLANGDAQKAVDRVREARLKSTTWIDGKKFKCEGFALTSVAVLAETTM